MVYGYLYILCNDYYGNCHAHVHSCKNISLVNCIELDNFSKTTTLATRMATLRTRGVETVCFYFVITVRNTYHGYNTIIIENQFN